MKKKISLFLTSILVVLSLWGNVFEANAATSKKAYSMSIKSSTGGDFVKGVSGAKISFKLKSSSSNVKLSITNSNGKSVYTKTYSKCKAKKDYTFTWSGKKSNGKYVSADYYSFKVKAGKTTTSASQKIYFYTTNDFAGGDGSKSNPYQVSTATQLRNVSKHNGRSFKQTADIDYKQSNITSLFSYEDPFTGDYNGNGYSIQNANYTGPDQYAGLFRAVGTSGKVRKVTISGWIASIGLRAGLICGLNNGKILNCKASDNLISGFGDYEGIICGSNWGMIQNCTTSGNTLSSSEDSIGGIAGYSGAGANILNCTAMNNTIKGSWYIGGIAGQNYGIVKLCVVNVGQGTISGSWRVGGIAGSNGGLCSDNSYDGQLNYIG